VFESAGPEATEKPVRRDPITGVLPLWTRPVKPQIRKARAGVNAFEFCGDGGHELVQDRKSAGAIEKHVFRRLFGVQSAAIAVLRGDARKAAREFVVFALKDQQVFELLNTRRIVEVGIGQDCRTFDRIVGAHCPPVLCSEALGSKSENFCALWCVRRRSGDVVQRCLGQSLSCNWKGRLRLECARDPLKVAIVGAQPI
jgi:hypothetical protein